MRLTPQQQNILDGGEGAVKAKVMKTLIQYGELTGYVNAHFIKPVY